MYDEGGQARASLGDAAYASRLARAFGALVALTFGLIVLGALVRVHEAGLACPDWPLCFGELVPRMNLEIAFEWTHRLVAGTVSLLFVGLGVLALRRGATRVAALRLLGVGAALLALQILLGALTVWQLLASWTVTSHLVTGNAFAVVLLWTALALRDAGPPSMPRASLPPAVRYGVVAGAVLLVAQIVLGGLVSSRYAGLSCPEWPACNGGAWFPTWRGPVGLHLLHRSNGYLLLVTLTALAFAARSAPRLRGLAALALALCLAQVLVGIANVLLGLPVEITGLHSALAAGLVLTLSVAVRELWLAPSQSDP